MMLKSKLAGLFALGALMFLPAAASAGGHSSWGFSLGFSNCGNSFGFGYSNFGNGCGWGGYRGYGYGVYCAPRPFYGYGGGYCGPRVVYV